MNDKFAYHYTIGRLARAIHESGVLEPETEHIPGNERPILWFVRYPQFTPTAYGIHLIHECFGSELLTKNPEPDTITICRMTESESRESYQGFIRLGLPLDRLKNWKTLKRESGMTTTRARSMTEGWKVAGSNPALWYGTFDEVPVSECLIEREVTPRVWEESTLEEIIAWSEAMNEEAVHGHEELNEEGDGESAGTGDNAGVEGHGILSPTISLLTP